MYLMNLTQWHITNLVTYCNDNIVQKKTVVPYSSIIRLTIHYIQPRNTKEGGSFSYNTTVTVITIEFSRTSIGNVSGTLHLRQLTRSKRPPLRPTTSPIRRRIPMSP